MKNHTLKLGNIIAFNFKYTSVYILYRENELGNVVISKLHMNTPFLLNK